MCCGGQKELGELGYIGSRYIVYILKRILEAAKLVPSFKVSLIQHALKCGMEIE